LILDFDMDYLSLKEAARLTRSGDCFIIVDDKERENEGDLFFAAEKITPEKMNFLIRFGRGLVCAPLTAEKADQLDLRLMVSDEQNKESTRCKFTVSIDARGGIASGISAADRAHTLQLLSRTTAAAGDFVKPGHIFPLIAHARGLEARAGHTEAAVTLCREAGLAPVGVICEIIADNGMMARGGVLEKFAAKHGLHIITIAEIKKSHLKKSNTDFVGDRTGITLAAQSRLPTPYGEFSLTIFQRKSWIPSAKMIAIPETT